MPAKQKMCNNCDYIGFWLGDFCPKCGVEFRWVYIDPADQNKPEEPDYERNKGS